MPSPFQAQPEGKKRKGLVVLVSCVVVVLLAVGALGAFLLMQGRESGAQQAVASGQQSVAAGSAISFEIDGETDSAHTFNISMLGLYVSGDGETYTSVDGQLEDSAGNVLYDDTLYYLNYMDGTVYGVSPRGEIVGVSSSGQATVLRDAAAPANLLAKGGTLYFVEDGLRRMRADGTDETLIAKDITGAFDVVGSHIYCIDMYNTLCRIPVAGGETEILSGLSVERFSIDGESIYLTLTGNSSLWRLDQDGSYMLVSNAMLRLSAPYFAVVDGSVYFTAPYMPVYMAELEDASGPTVVEDSATGFFYFTGEGVAVPPYMPLPPGIEVTDQ